MTVILYFVGIGFLFFGSVGGVAALTDIRQEAGVTALVAGIVSSCIGVALIRKGQKRRELKSLARLAEQGCEQP